MRCVCCDALINDHAKNTELCYVCLDIVKNYWIEDSDKSGRVHVLSEEEIENLYLNKEYISLEY